MLVPLKEGPMPGRTEQTLPKKQQVRRYELDRVRVDCTCGLGGRGSSGMGRGCCLAEALQLRDRVSICGSQEQGMSDD